MKKYFLALTLSAAMLLSSCAGNTAVSENSETVQAAEISDTVTTSETTTEVTSETTLQTSPTTVEETSPMPPEIEKYYVTDSFIEIPLSYEGREVYLDNVCREVVEGCGYEDFPAKEDIAPAIECAFENYFKGTSVYYMDDRGEQPCTVENLSFKEGLYLDFDNDGENESIIVITNNSEAPFTGNMTFIYIDREIGALALEKYDERYDRKSSHIYGLVYDDCVNLITESGHGTVSETILYTYENGGFKAAWGSSSIWANGAAVSCWEPFGSGYDCPIRLVWNPEKKQYDAIGREEISYEELTKKIPEMKMLCAEIERVHQKEITSIETEGGLNFYFFMGDTYTTAYVDDFTIGEYTSKGFLRTEIRSKRNANDVNDCKSVAELYGYDNDIVYGLFLTYAVPDRRAAE